MIDVDPDLMLIDLDQAKAQIRLTHDEEDDEIEEMIKSASTTIARYLDTGASFFLDSSGMAIEDAVPADIKTACKLEVAHLYKNREGQSDSKIPDQYGYAYPLCAAAIAKLAPYYTPTFV